MLSKSCSLPLQNTSASNLNLNYVKNPTNLSTHSHTELESEVLPINSILIINTYLYSEPNMVYPHPNENGHNALPHHGSETQEFIHYR